MFKTRNVVLILFLAGCVQHLPPTPFGDKEHTKNSPCSDEQMKKIKHDLGLAPDSQLPADLLFYCQ